MEPPARALPEAPGGSQAGVAGAPLEVGQEAVGPKRASCRVLEVLRKLGIHNIEWKSHPSPAPCFMCQIRNPEWMSEIDIFTNPARSAADH